MRALIRSCGQTSFISLLMMTLWLGFGLTPPAASAAEYSTPIFGGSGGKYSYNLDCGRGAVITGLVFKSGSYVDAIGVLCRKVNASTGRLGEEFTRGPKGGYGGTPKERKCPSGAVINKVKAHYGAFVNFFATTCYVWDHRRKRPGSIYKDQNGRGVYPRAGSPCSSIDFGCKRTEHFTCPSGKAGKAVRGRYGGFIDSLRFVCDAWDQ